MATPYKMKGHTLPGPNQKASPAKIVWAPIIASAVVSGLGTAYSMKSSANQAARDKNKVRKTEELKKSENAFQNDGSKAKKKLVKMDGKLTE